MSTTYQGIRWNRQKVVCDLIILFLVVIGLLAFIGTSILLYPSISIKILLLRGTAFLSLFLLHVILAIGPLARLSSDCLPLLYNRRHLGVTLSVVALFHGVLALVHYHAFGDTFLLVSVLTSYADAFGNLLGGPAGWGEIPFEPFGILALAILLLLAASSHDFWSCLFGASAWRALHTLLYVAYVLVIVHVAFGLVQSEKNLLYPGVLLAAALLLFSLHVAAYRKGGRLSPASEDRKTGDGDVATCSEDAVAAGQGAADSLETRRMAIREELQTVLAVLLVACPVYMGLMAYAQAKPDRGRFESGITRTVEGVLYTSPVPSVYVVADGPADAAPQGYHILLASDEKFGIPPEWSEFDGKKISVTGSAMYRREIMMLLVDRDILPTVLGNPDVDELRPDSQDYGSIRVVGELVDTRCYLGAMRPATGKVHKACAIRCLSGGVPPGILVQEEFGSTVIFLAGKGTNPLKYDISWAGQSIEAFGALHRFNGFSAIFADTVSLHVPGTQRSTPPDEALSN